MAKKWEPSDKFNEYAKFIANHPNYSGMPDLYWDEDKKLIQWEAPSNRGGGKFEHSHTKRLEWWKKKAVEVGIDPKTTNEWISKTAKKIHPTSKKPCKVCGRVMDIRYAYPSNNFIRRVLKLNYVPEEYSIDSLEHIKDLITRMVDDFGNQVLSDLPKLLKAKGIEVPKSKPNLDAWLEWVDNEYIPQEPSILSPGAMSNAPDRLDGFHTFNKCCRSSADKGRHKKNLLSYTTDRRVFEYWNEGNWIAANKMMGLVKTKFIDEGCLNGHKSKSTADHIGPLSLGFSHRPEFQLLCSACNSGKNNRMMLSDVKLLMEREEGGVRVVSWYAKRIWDLRKDSVDSPELALRLSKLMRDNWHNAAYLLGEIAKLGHFTFLISLMDISFADFDYEFKNLRVENFVTKFDELIKIPKTTKYVAEQKARAVRVALESLITYIEKGNRNTYLVEKDRLQESINRVDKVLKSAPSEIKELDKNIEKLLSTFENINSDAEYKKIIGKLPKQNPEAFAEAKSILTDVLDIVAEKLSDDWSSSRYVRDDSFSE